MSIDTLNTIISRASTDVNFRWEMFNNFDQAIKLYELDEREKSMLRRVTPNMMEAAIERLNSWHQPQSSASMELLQLLFGKDLNSRERRMDSMPRLGGKRFPVAIFAGIAVIGLIATVAVVLTLGSMRRGPGVSSPDQGSSGASESVSDPAITVVVPTEVPSSLACTCTEDCSGVACITICADTNGDRCVP